MESIFSAPRGFLIFTHYSNEIRVRDHKKAQESRQCRRRFFLKTTITSTLRFSSWIGDVLFTSSLAPALSAFLHLEQFSSVMLRNAIFFSLFRCGKGVGAANDIISPQTCSSAPRVQYATI